MKIFIYEDDFKYIAEPYFLEAFSNERNTILFVPESGEWLLEDEDCEIIRFPEDIIKMNFKGDFNSNWDYSILPDHGIEDYLNPNVFSDKRKGRIYRRITLQYIKENLTKKYHNLPLFQRSEDKIQKDKEIFELKFHVKNFVELF
ncbi:MAG: hypothetical protein M0R46_04475 [Candidatus Muirbacterium halophilum]|nr:hypothetical protein [Candidatus Muirbacterium halophilum]MCK9475150.1 hypothetical protein [Candidatus Muirbacterium halophilum]